MNGRTLLTLALGLAVASAGCHATPPGAPAPAPASAASPFQGAWRLVRATYTQPSGSVQTMDSTQLTHLKVIDGNHFAYITQAADGRFIRAAGGTYRFDAATYTEHIELTSSDAMRGLDFTFGYRLDGDTWYQTGPVGGTKIEEVYRRVR